MICDNLVVPLLGSRPRDYLPKPAITDDANFVRGSTVGTKLQSRGQCTITPKLIHAI
jgi:hypothetical protein